MFLWAYMSIADGQSYMLYHFETHFVINVSNMFLLSMFFISLFIESIFIKTNASYITHHTPYCLLTYTIKIFNTAKNPDKLHVLLLQCSKM